MNPTDQVNRNAWIDTLRSSITMLVVFHHAALAYTTFARFDAEVYIRSTHPVVDPERSPGLDIIVNYNDIFFMSLMFFIGGLFIFKSVTKKGALFFVRDRFLRLLLPFLVLGTLFMLIAYMPAYMLSKGAFHAQEYVVDFFTVRGWPVGPPWFLWVLFAFNLLLCLIIVLFKRAIGKLAASVSNLANRPVLLVLVFFFTGGLLYIPLAFYWGPYVWIGSGPFDLQVSRILLYFGYFFLGVLAGAANINEGLLSKEGRVIRNRWIWAALALIVFAVLITLTQFRILEKAVTQGLLTAFSGWMIYYTVFMFSCVFSCLAFLSFFRVAADRPGRWMRSISENAYLIYLVHYTYVIWIQFGLLHVAIPALIKFLIVFVGSVLLELGNKRAAPQKSTAATIPVIAKG